MTELETAAKEFSYKYKHPTTVAEDKAHVRGFIAGAEYQTAKQKEQAIAFAEFVFDQQLHRTGLITTSKLFDLFIKQQQK